MLVSWCCWLSELEFPLDVQLLLYHALSKSVTVWGDMKCKRQVAIAYLPDTRLPGMLCRYGKAVICLAVVVHVQSYAGKRSSSTGVLLHGYS